MSLLLMHNSFRNLDQTPKKKREDQYHSVFTVNVKLQSAARFFAQGLERKKKWLVCQKSQSIHMLVLI